ncbi:hypothetical protein GCM10007385_03380 [Tateyamaria omphalii]|uniref:hypothetical protein n=1 Tax=Tateyamaria omphalii TaxID=299262 RepID=UPI001676D526|nr:hypothetical protein [Tateyamaria omphalii]GGX39610.1 hypothetical protein GCM10007385_03380 [Tateyamaria omphalii]
MAQGHDVFAARLARLNETHAEHQARQSATAKAARGSTPDWVRNLVYPGSIVGALFVGILTVVLSRYVFFHINGAPDPNADADLTMIMDGGLALAIAFVLRSALHLTAKEHLAAKTAGIWIALTCMHNLVHAYPAVWATAFSPEWVERTTAMTEPRSFFIRGITFTFDDIGGADKADGSSNSEAASNSKPEIKINRY